MQLKSLTIGNFKCFKEEKTFDLERITLLTGANSSGKSSLIYAILGAMQSESFPLNFSPNGKYVNMGDFESIVYGNEKDKDIVMGFVFGVDDKEALEYKLKTSWKKKGQSEQISLKSITSSSDYFSMKGIDATNGYNINFYYNAIQNTVNGHLSSRIKESFITRSEEKISSLQQQEVQELSKMFDKEFYEITNVSNWLIQKFENDEAMNEHKNISNMFDIFKFKLLVETLKHIFDSYNKIYNFLGSFRLPPQRTYLMQNKVDFRVNTEGEGYLDQILDWEKKKDERLKNLVKELKAIGLLHGIKSKKLGGGRFEVLVQVNKGGKFVPLSDVGMGISQFLPILVADYQLSDNSTLCVSEPEIHLHPSIQSNIGAYLMRQVKKTEKNYVIETHSEYLLNRIRLGIVKGEIDAKDVAVYFMENNNNDTDVHRITFNKKGQILNAPDNFFKTYMIDVMQIAMAAV